MHWQVTFINSLITFCIGFGIGFGISRLRRRRR